VTLLWATRGRTWGFRFLRHDGQGDPLLEYERGFATFGSDDEGVSRVGDRVALRFTDPEGRCDRSGRVIPHEFVVSGELAAEVGTVDDGLRVVWPLVRDEYAKIWGAEPRR